MRAITYSLNRIAERFPELTEEELAFVGECLEDCFEIGRTWDTIPILVHEARPPAAAPKKRQNRRKGRRAKK